jgi:chloramphenicol 3-O-phosphotransferase
MAYYAIRLGNIQQHKEWMIRTYVLACNGVVGDRILADIPVLTRRIGVDAVSDLSGWMLWALPLMVAEVVIQMKKLRRIRRSPKNALS